jgi:hypothetical protein
MAAKTIIPGIAEWIVATIRGEFYQGHHERRYISGSEWSDRRVDLLPCSNPAGANKTIRLTRDRKKLALVIDAPRWPQQLSAPGARYAGRRKFFLNAAPLILAASREVNRQPGTIINQ